MTVDDLSTDQKYLYKIFQAVGTGNCSPELEALCPGKLSNARWLTLANRLLRLYVATKKPSQALKILVQYIQNVYAPCWFLIKKNGTIKDAGKLIFELIRRSRFLPTNLRAEVQAVIQRNGYCCHPETLLVSMVCDERKNIREKAVNLIIDARNCRNTRREEQPSEVKPRRRPRKQQDTEGEIRRLRVPKVNMDAQEYQDLVSWETIDPLSYVSPSVLQCKTNEEILSFIEENPSSDDCFRFPCHTQSVERCVKSVTEAAATVSAKNRDGLIRARLASRKEMPLLNTKKQLKKGQ